MTSAEHSNRSIALSLEESQRQVTPPPASGGSRARPDATSNQVPHSSAVGLSANGATYSKAVPVVSVLAAGLATGEAGSCELTHATANRQRRQVTSPTSSETRPDATFARLAIWSSLPLIWLIYLYRMTLAPLMATFFGGGCRFEPSCSHYAEDALRKYGAWRGSIMAVKRLLRCHPWHDGGYDPVG